MKASVRFGAQRHAETVVVGNYTCPCGNYSLQADPSPYLRSVFVQCPACGREAEIVPADKEGDDG